MKIDRHYLMTEPFQSLARAAIAAELSKWIGKANPEQYGSSCGNDRKLYFRLLSPRDGVCGHATVTFGEDGDIDSVSCRPVL